MNMNTTTNGSLCSATQLPTAFQIAATVAYSLIFVVSIFGNSCLIIVVFKTQTLRKTINFLIVNMAISDLLIPLIRIPWQVLALHQVSWLFRGDVANFMCKLNKLLTTLSVLVSIQSLVLVAVDRFRAVVFPFRRPFINTKRCMFLIFSTWFVAMAIASPYFFTQIHDKRGRKLTCGIKWKEVFGESSSSNGYYLPRHLIFVYIPIFLLIILYSVILIKVKSQNISGNQSITNGEKQRRIRNRNVLKMALAIVVGFILCWLPHNVNSILQRFVPEKLPCGFSLYRQFTTLLMASYCIMNPCICFTLSRNYRQALNKLFKCFPTQP